MPVSEKRRFQRGFKSYRVVYGLENPLYPAFARRLSPDGMFIATNGVVYTEGVRLVMDLEVEGRVHRAEGVVRHSMKVDPRLVRILKPGMGIHFTKISEELRAAILAGR